MESLCQRRGKLLKLEKRTDAGSGGLVKALADGNSAAASATCDYG
ncbi:MAG: hypothetical protein U0894_13705 [Pirellulales bacterium]